MESTPDTTGRAIETAVLFVDLVSSSEFSSILSLRAYADYVAAFEAVCTRQCDYFFGTFHEGQFRRGADYSLQILGDELVVFLHPERQPDAVYQLICLAVTLKCAWLASPVNVERMGQGGPSVELAVGIHAGPVWATPHGDGYTLRGFAINVAKRVETASRDGEHFRIFVSGAAFKRVNRKLRTLLIGGKKLVTMKGIVLPVAVHELVDSFIEPSTRMVPEFADAFCRVASTAIAANSFDTWIHSCYQLSAGCRDQRVTDPCMDLCRDVLAVHPENGVALFFIAQGLIERDQLPLATLYLTDLTRHWPTFTDGWLELARTAKRTGNTVLAEHAVLQARRHGAADDEEALPATGS